MFKVSSLFLIVIGLLAGPWAAIAQSPTDVLGRTTTDHLVYSGPGTNAAYMEYLDRNRDVILSGRNSNSTWLEVNIDGQIVGWVPAGAISVTRGEVSSLPVKGGLLDLGKGPYDVNDSSLRAAEIELILVNRPMRFIGARWFRLQALIGASCINLPAMSARPSISAGRIPELERVQRELTYVYEQTELAIQVYTQLCAGGNAVTDLNQVNRGIGHLNNAYSAYDVVRLYLNELAGLEYVIQ
jgi:hypothetical protein